MNIGCRCIIALLEAQTEGKSNSWYNRFRCLFCDRRRKYLVSVPAPRETICLMWDGDVGPFGGNKKEEMRESRAVVREYVPVGTKLSVSFKPWISSKPTPVYDRQSPRPTAVHKISRKSIIQIPR